MEFVHKDTPELWRPPLIIRTLSSSCCPGSQLHDIIDRVVYKATPVMWIHHQEDILSYSKGVCTIDIIV